jgi:cold shock CspA family protein
LPSRAAILDALKPAPLSPIELGRSMSVDKRARDAFFGRIDAMQRDGELLLNRKGELCVTAKLDLVTGTVQGHPDGYGFLVPDDGGADFFLGQSEMHKVLHGDRATARRSGVDRRGRPEGQIVDVLTRANQTVVGRLYDERGITFVVAENRRINQDLLVPPDERGVGEDGRRGRRRDRPAALAAARGDRACRRSSGGLHGPRHGDRDRAPQARSAARVLARRAQAGGEAGHGGHRARPRGSHRPARPRARHDRRRNGERLRRRRLLRAQGQRLSASSSRSPTSRTT